MMRGRTTTALHVDSATTLALSAAAAAPAAADALLLQSGGYCGPLQHWTVGAPLA